MPRKGPPAGSLPPSGYRDKGTERPPSHGRGPTPCPSGRSALPRARAFSGSRKQKAGPASPAAPNSVVLEDRQDGGEDGGRGVSGFFPGGGGGGAGPQRVTASASGRLLAPGSGAPCAGWPGQTVPAPARKAGGTGLGPARPCSLLEVRPSGWGSAQASKAVLQQPQPKFPFSSFRSPDDNGALRLLLQEVPQSRSLVS